MRGKCGNTIAERYDCKVVFFPTGGIGVDLRKVRVERGNHNIQNWEGILQSRHKIFGYKVVVLVEETTRGLLDDASQGREKNKKKQGGGEVLTYHVWESLHPVSLPLLHSCVLPLGGSFCQNLFALQPPTKC